MLQRSSLCSLAIALSAAAVCSASVAQAAPAAPKPEQLKKDLGGKDVVKIDLRPGGGVSAGDGIWVFEQTAEVHRKTEWKGVTKVSRGDVEYHYQGRQWRYIRFRSAGTTYAGFSPPTAAEAKEAIAAGKPIDFFGNHLHEKVTELHSMTLAPDPQWKTDLEFATFRAIGEYSYKLDPRGKTVIRERDEFQLEVTRSDPKAAWTALCKDKKKCISGHPLANNGKSFKRISEDTHSDNAEVKTLAAKEEGEWVQGKLEGLGLPEKWTDLREFAKAAYKVLYTGDKETWKAFLFKTRFDQQVFDTGVSVFVQHAAEIRAQFCPDLLFYETRGRPGLLSVSFKDKGQHKKCYLSVEDFNGFRVTEMGCEATRGEKGAEIAKIPESEGCKDPEVAKAAQAAENAAKLGFAVGDKVHSKFHGNGKEYPGTIKAIDGDKIQVHYDDNDEEWVPAAAVRKR